MKDRYKTLCLQPDSMIEPVALDIAKEEKPQERTQEKLSAARGRRSVRSRLDNIVC
jgi:hypothetical protein